MNNWMRRAAEAIEDTDGSGAAHYRDLIEAFFPYKNMIYVAAPPEGEFSQELVAALNVGDWRTVAFMAVVRLDEVNRKNDALRTALEKISDMLKDL